MSRQRLWSNQHPRINDREVKKSGTELKLTFQLDECTILQLWGNQSWWRWRHFGSPPLWRLHTPCPSSFNNIQKWNVSPKIYRLKDHRNVLTVCLITLICDDRTKSLRIRHVTVWCVHSVSVHWHFRRIKCQKSRFFSPPQRSLWLVWIIFAAHLCDLVKSGRAHDRPLWKTYWTALLLKCAI